MLNLQIPKPSPIHQCNSPNHTHCQPEYSNQAMKLTFNANSNNSDQTKRYSTPQSHRDSKILLQNYSTLLRSPNQLQSPPYDNVLPQNESFIIPSNQTSPIHKIPEHVQQDIINQYKQLYQPTQQQFNPQATQYQNTRIQHTPLRYSPQQQQFIQKVYSQQQPDNTLQQAQIEQYYKQIMNYYEMLNHDVNIQQSQNIERFNEVMYKIDNVHLQLLQLIDSQGNKQKQEYSQILYELKEQREQNMQMIQTILIAQQQQQAKVLTPQYQTMQSPQFSHNQSQQLIQQPEFNNYQQHYQQQQQQYQQQDNENKFYQRSQEQQLQIDNLYKQNQFKIQSPNDISKQTQLGYATNYSSNYLHDILSDIEKQEKQIQDELLSLNKYQKREIALPQNPINVNANQNQNSIQNLNQNTNTNKSRVPNNNSQHQIQNHNHNQIHNQNQNLREQYGTKSNEVILQPPKIQAISHFQANNSQISQINSHVPHKQIFDQILVDSCKQKQLSSQEEEFKKGIEILRREQPSSFMSQHQKQKIFDQSNLLSPVIVQRGQQNNNSKQSNNQYCQEEMYFQPEKQEYVQNYDMEQDQSYLIEEANQIGENQFYEYLRQNYQIVNSISKPNHGDQRLITKDQEAQDLLEYIYCTICDQFISTKQANNHTKICQYQIKRTARSDAYLDLFICCSQPNDLKIETKIQKKKRLMIELNKISYLMNLALKQKDYTWEQHKQREYSLYAIEIINQIQDCSVNKLQGYSDDLQTIFLILETNPSDFFRQIIFLIQKAQNRIKDLMLLK